MSFTDQISQIKISLVKKLKCCTAAYIEKEILNAQLDAIIKKIDELDQAAKQKKTKGGKDV